MPTPRYNAGDLVIYSMPKHSRQPGPRAQSVHPATSGDDYSYVVEKYWVVVGATEENQIQIKTRRGKTRTVRADDPLLRPASWWEKWRHKSRFPDAQTSADSGST